MPAKQEQANAYYGYSLTQMLPNELKYPKLPYPQRNYKMIHITNKSVEKIFKLECKEYSVWFVSGRITSDFLSIPEQLRL